MSSIITLDSMPSNPALHRLHRQAPAAFADHAFAGTGSNYAFISTKQLVDALMQARFQPTEARQRRSRGERGGYARHMIRFRHERESMVVVDCTPEIILINSHDGSSSYQLRGGLYRFVCCNGLIVSLSEFGVIRVPHRGNVIADVVEGALEITRHFAGIGATIEQMARTVLAEDEQRAFAQRALEIRYRGRDQFPFEAVKLLEARRAEDTRNDLWTVYNRLQENVIRGGIVSRSTAGRMTRSRRIGSIPEDIRINLDLWQAATALIRA